MTKGGKNLVILGTSAVVIAVVFTSISLAIYHNSGDIYLDRSRPGFLPDEKEIEEESTKNDYKFSEYGEIKAADIEEYRDNLDKEIKEIDNIPDPFSAEALSDKALGI